jgi:hypothetical protein
MAAVTLPLDIAIRQKAATGFAVVVFNLLLAYVSLLVKPQKKFLRDSVVQRKGSAGIVVEEDAETSEGGVKKSMEAIDHLLGCDPLAIGTDCDGDAMLVGTTNKQYVVALETLIPHEHVGGQIGSRKMA